jgi:hypothetical protein
MAKNTAVFGIYPTYGAVDGAVESLRASGFRATDISVLFPENVGTKDFAHEKGTKASEGAAAGGTTGVIIGGALGWLAGIGALAIPGLGAFIAAGPIVAALAGAGAGSVAGGIVGSLIGLGIPEYEAKRYEGRVKKGGILLSVHSDDSDWTARAKRVLEQTGAEDISSTGETKGDLQNADRPLPRDATM